MTDNRTNEPTAARLRELVANLIPLDLIHDRHRPEQPKDAYEAADRIISTLRAHGLLSEGAPSEEQIARGVRACIESAEVPTGMRAHIVDPDGVPVIRERVDISTVVAVILTAAGVAPQTLALDPEKVAEVIDRAQVTREVGEDGHTSIGFASGKTIARALCEAYTEGKLNG